MDEVLASFPSDGTTVSSSVSRSNVKNVFQRNQERSVDDHMAEDMQNALNAYGKVALKRFVDDIPMLCNRVMQEFADKMNDALHDTSEEEIERIVVAPADVIAQKNKARQTADTLIKGIDALRYLF